MELDWVRGGGWREPPPLMCPRANLAPYHHSHSGVDVNLYALNDPGVGDRRLGGAMDNTDVGRYVFDLMGWPTTGTVAAAVAAVDPSDGGAVHPPSAFIARDAGAQPPPVAATNEYHD